MKKFKTLGIAFLALATMILGACAGPNNNSSSAPDGPTSTFAVLHGNGAPENSLGVDFNIYVDDVSSLVYEKNNGEWITRETLAKFDNISSTSNTAGSQTKLMANILNAAARSDIRNDIDFVQLIVSTVYSTNISFNLEMYFNDEAPQMTGTYKIDGSKIDIALRSATDNSLFQAGHAKYNNSTLIFDFTYPEMEEPRSAHVLNREIVDTYLTALPIPSLESLVFTNALVYDDIEKGPVSMAMKYINTMTFENGVYTIANIPYTYTDLSTYYASRLSGTGVLDFSFTLDEDNLVNKIQYDVTYASGDTAHYVYDIYDYHKTVVADCAECSAELSK